MDKLTALTQHMRDFREASLLLYTETWQTALMADTVAELAGVQLIRVDRTQESGKMKGGGLAVFVNDK